MSAIIIVTEKEGSLKKMETSHLVCPVCKERLFQKEKSLVCQNGHCFDLAKEGYVNLLCGSHKSADLTGDNKLMAKARHEFLEKGLFFCLAGAVSDCIFAQGKTEPVVADICCGEGYYSSEVLKAQRCSLYGFDLSRAMVRLAAKRKLDATFFVANLSSIPLESECVDSAFVLFAPFHEKEFSRILKKDGVLITAVPGKNHLFELKEKIYYTPYKNDEKLPQTSLLTLCDTIKVKDKIKLEKSDDIMSLFSMTPYYYHTPKEGMERARALEELETEVEFVLGIYKKS